MTDTVPTAALAPVEANVPSVEPQPQPNLGEMALHQQTAALADECQAIIGHHKSEIISLVFDMNWNLGKAIYEFQQSTGRNLVQICSDLEALGVSKDHSTLAYYVRGYRYAVEHLGGRKPEGLSWSAYRALLADHGTEDPEPKPKPKAVRRSDIAAYTTDKIGQVWTRQDADTITELLGV